MTLNIIDLIKSQLCPTLIPQAATQFGESESGISKTMNGLIPAMVGGLANSADNPEVSDAIMSPASNGMLGNLIGQTSNNPLIDNTIKSVFGEKIGELLDGISNFSGVSNSTSSSILKMITGATLVSLGKYARENNLDAAGISSLLKEQKGIVSTSLPVGLSLASLGLGNIAETKEVENITVSDPGSPKQTAVTSDSKIDVNRGGATHVNVDNEPNGGGSIWKWLVPLLLLIAVAIFLFNRFNDKKDSVVMNNTQDSMMMNENMSTDTINTTTSMNKVDEDIDLNGTMIKGYKGGMEDNMIAFLKANKYKDAKSDAELKDTWYNFDKVNFEMGSSDQLLAGSEGQMKNLVAILKAYPETKIKIGGYTDNIGDAKVNKELSQKRADFLKNQLTQMGVGSQVTGAEGYGSEMATVPASASDTERAVDRNMAVRFTK